MPPFYPSGFIHIGLSKFGSYDNYRQLRAQDLRHTKMSVAPSQVIGFGGSNRLPHLCFCLPHATTLLTCIRNLACLLSKNWLQWIMHLLYVSYYIELWFCRMLFAMLVRVCNYSNELLIMYFMKGRMTF